MRFSILPRDFYSRSTVTVAKDLLGKLLVRKINNKIVSGIIIETEAYKNDDPASHTFIGKTKRNQAMFEEVGCAYVYTTYGIHNCLDIVARSAANSAGGVLIRSIKPIHGIDIMKQHRFVDNISNLCNGPAKITQALKITKEHYGMDLTSSKDFFIAQGLTKKYSIYLKPRIGISKGLDKMWNFSIKI